MADQPYLAGAKGRERLGAGGISNGLAIWSYLPRFTISYLSCLASRNHIFWFQESKDIVIFVWLWFTRPGQLSTEFKREISVLLRLFLDFILGEDADDGCELVMFGG